MKNKDCQFEIIDKIFSIGIIFYINKKILKSVLKTAIDIGESVYDCTFIATAEHFGGEFITDDKKLYENYIKYGNSKVKVILLKTIVKYLNEIIYFNYIYPKKMYNKVILNFHHNFTNNYCSSISLKI